METKPGNTQPDNTGNNPFTNNNQNQPKSDLNPAYTGMNSYAPNAGSNEKVDPLQAELNKMATSKIDTTGPNEPVQPPAPASVPSQPVFTNPTPSSQSAAASAPVNPGFRNVNQNPASSTVQNTAPKPVMTSAQSTAYAKSTQPTVDKNFSYSNTTSHPVSKTSNGTVGVEKLWTIVGVIAIIIILLGGLGYWYTQKGSGTATSTDNGAPVSNGTTSKPGTPKPSPTTTKPNQNTPMVARQKAVEYLQKNINSLSPIKSATPFKVTEIVFDAPDRAIVTYTNGRETYVAVALMTTIDAAGNINVLSFTLLEK